jgi:hypothetical protein
MPYAYEHLYLADAISITLGELSGGAPEGQGFALAWDGDTPDLPGGDTRGGARKQKSPAFAELFWVP